jgi:hypothetical protein
MTTIIDIKDIKAGFLMQKFGKIVKINNEDGKYEIHFDTGMILSNINPKAVFDVIPSNEGGQRKRTIKRSNLRKKSARRRK